MNIFKAFLGQWAQYTYGSPSEYCLFHRWVCSSWPIRGAIRRYLHSYFQLHSSTYCQSVQTAQPVEWPVVWFWPGVYWWHLGWGRCHLSWATQSHILQSCTPERSKGRWERINSWDGRAAFHLGSVRGLQGSIWKPHTSNGKERQGSCRWQTRSCSFLCLKRHSFAFWWLRRRSWRPCTLSEFDQRDEVEWNLQRNWHLSESRSSSSLPGDTWISRDLESAPLGSCQVNEPFWTSSSGTWNSIEP